ncbi:MAG: phosphohydrolases family protein [Elusimicrobia bacterium]|nr:MAG: phosphohydrolases family protein [Elusimicrobiota bacterium]KAF0156987.1 MAG: phosphohydrolases family protein [Elusimicrobiota bacterium]
MKPAFIFVFALMMGVYVWLHFYAAGWLARNFAPHLAGALRLSLLIMALLSPASMFVRRMVNAPLEHLYTAAFIWMGLIFLWGMGFLVYDGFRLALAAAVRPLPAWAPRAFCAILAALTAVSLYNGFRTPDIRRFDLAVPGLPDRFDGLKIAQISDMHIDSGYQLVKFRGAVEKIAAEAPDLIVFTGDLLDPGIRCEAELERAVAALKPRLGMFGAPGNHEYYYGLDRSLGCYEHMGINLLRNSTAEAGGLKIAGLDDIRTAGLDEADVERVLAPLRDEPFALVLSHQPLLYDVIARKGRFLVLSGHTHRGQIFPFHFFTRLAYRYFYGLYRIGDSFFYVTSGAGTWGPPMRLLAPAEVPLITLRKA